MSDDIIDLVDTEEEPEFDNTPTEKPEKEKPVREKAVKEKVIKEKPVKEKVVKEKPSKDVKPKRRERPIEAKDVFAAADEQDVNSFFRMRLAYLMNGNNDLGKPVNIQELADAVGVSRPAIRKYLKPKDKGAPTTPSAATVCAIAKYFGTTPNFLLGFDSDDAEAARRAVESEYYNALGLNQRTIERLRELREHQAAETGSENAAALMSMLDRLVCSFAEDALKLLEK